MKRLALLALLPLALAGCSTPDSNDYSQNLLPLPEHSASFQCDSGNRIIVTFPEPAKAEEKAAAPCGPDAGKNAEKAKSKEALMCTAEEAKAAEKAKEKAKDAPASIVLKYRMEEFSMKKAASSEGLRYEGEGFVWEVKGRTASLTGKLDGTAVNETCTAVPR